MPSDLTFNLSRFYKTTQLQRIECFVKFAPDVNVGAVGLEILAL